MKPAVLVMIVLIAAAWLIPMYLRQRRRQLTPIDFSEPGPWRVVLHEHDEVKAAMVLRASLRLSLGDALERITNPPRTLVSGVAEEAAQRLVERLRAVGAQAELVRDA